jgi:(p)ppGpp synthase/HD superfamily hydrolase
MMTQTHIQEIRKIQNIVQKAKAIAKLAHRGQTRRDGTPPYITHPEAVANLLTSDDEKAIAWLHDVIEDTTVTQDDLLNCGIPIGFLISLDLLTKKETDNGLLGILHPRNHEEESPYTNYIQRIKGSSKARRVKIADIICNLTDDPTPKQKARYKKALQILTLSDTPTNAF